MKYEKLFRTLTVKNITIPNRIVMAPMTTVSGSTTGAFSAEEIHYIKQRAEGGVGMIISPACYVHKSGHAFDRQVGCHNDEMMPSLTECADAINSAGSISLLQIHHGGNASKEKLTGRPPMAPSAVKNRSGNSELPQAMTENEIREIIESFAEASKRAEKAGFHGVEIHGANTYLLQQFFSPFTNKRTDKWGGDNNLPGRNHLENRSRFALEVVKAIRFVVDDKFIVAYRLSPEESDPKGYSVKDAISLLKIIIPYGVDIVHVSSWKYGESLRPDVPSGSHPTYMIKEALPYMPVIGVGGISNPDQAMRIMNEGIEFAALGKALLLDKDWVKKVQEGRADTICRSIDSLDDIGKLDLPPRMKKYLAKFYPF